ncbi:MAG TPA: amidohydrolase family protein, partial [Aggregatilineales bacterium]|nr:amidohydrolase family protein [Aggregatilineales bacterium]
QTGDPTALPADQILLMATRLGAAALHMDNITGSLEAGKRADLLIMNDAPLHMSPQFRHNPKAVYGRIVYASKSSDIEHVMCNGVWLMRHRELLTLDEQKIQADASIMARKIDSFIASLAENNLNKLVAIGGVEQEQSFEIQTKIRVASDLSLKVLLGHRDVKIDYSRHYDQYDHYFVFDNGTRIRYREDDFRDERGTVTTVRTRLTYTAPGEERRNLGDAALLSRSRFIAPAAYPLRFYREYFNAPLECEVEKKRLRWKIQYRGVEYYVNFDEVLKPRLRGYYLEIKSRTWSPEDAERKAGLMQEILNKVLRIAPQDIVPLEYIDMVLTDMRR